MKRILTIFLIFTFSSIYGQKKDFKWWLKRYKYTAPIMFSSGVADGHVEILTHKYHKFQDKFPNADPNKWNPDLTWRNKWRNGNPIDGEKFPLSSTVLVALTDPYHALRAYEHLSTSLAVIIPIVGKREKFYVYLIDLLVISGFKSLGFVSTYQVFYKGNKP